MIKTIASPRKSTPKGAASPRATTATEMRSGVKSASELSPASTPRTPRKLEARANTKILSPRKKEKTAAVPTAKKIEVMELPARLVAGSNKPLNFKGTSHGDRIRNGSGDTCMRLPLDCLSKSEIKSELQEGKLIYHHPLIFENDDNTPGNPDEEEELEEFDEEKMITVLGPDRARFNVWKGKNYDLHLLGDFKSDFERKVKSFQRPETKLVSLDPFCRSETSLKDEPCNGDAFVIWKNRDLETWKVHSNNNSQHDITTATLLSSDDEGDTADSDMDSLPDPEITSYINNQKEKIKEGVSASGETLIYDDEFDVVRNLHRDSYSLTNYGITPDDTWMGKAHVFYPEMTAEERKSKEAYCEYDSA